MFRALQRWFRMSRVHLRQNEVTNPADLVALIDRFMDNKLLYELEWDDFISWAHSNAAIESLRDRIAGMEPSFFSKDPLKRAEALVVLLSARNDAASLASLPARSITQ